MKFQGEKKIHGRPFRGVHGVGLPHTVAVTLERSRKFGNRARLYDTMLRLT